MPERAMKARKQYSVTTLSYAEGEDREFLSNGKIPAFESELVYRGPSKALALQAFGRACIAQTGDPLAYSVTLKYAGEIIAEVKPVRL